MAFFNPLQLALKPLLERAINEDKEFATEVKDKESRKDNPKSFAECCEFILGEAYEFAKEHKDGNCGVAGMSDDDLVGLIKHYYDEDDIKVKKMSGATAKVSGKADKKSSPKKETPRADEQKKEEKKEEPKAEVKKTFTKAELKRGDDCYSLFDLMN